VSDADIKRLLVLLDIAITSSYDGEAETALRAALREMRTRHMRAQDLLGTSSELDLANETIATLVNENTALRNELEHRDTQSTAIAPTWQAVGAAITNTQRTIVWLLDLRERGIAWLTPREQEFLVDVRDAWSGPLTPAQQRWFQTICDRVCGRTGLQPPT
jgi:hypothetical protein